MTRSGRSLVNVILVLWCAPTSAVSSRAWASPGVPFPGSSMVVRAGYGIYYDTSVYQTIAVQMAQQPPLSKTLSVQNSAADPLTLANGFIASPAITGNTFAIDPNFRPGYAQNWQVAVQRDLPGSLQLTATYLGIKGTRGPQEFLPEHLSDRRGESVPGLSGRIRFT